MSSAADAVGRPSPRALSGSPVRAASVRSLRRADARIASRSSRTRVLRRADLALIALIASGTAISGLVAPSATVVVAVSWWWARRDAGLAGLRSAGIRALSQAGLLAFGAGSAVLLLLDAAAGEHAALQLRPVLALVAVLVAAHVIARIVIRSVRGPLRLVVVDGADAPDNGSAFGGAGVRVVAVSSSDVLEPVTAPHEDPLVALVRDTAADAVALAPSAVRTTDLAAVARRVGRDEIAVVTAIDGLAERRVSFDAAAGAYGRTVLAVAPHGASRSQRILAGVLDRVLAALLLVASAPLLAGLGLLVRLDSRGPAFFHQERVGRDGRRFVIHKLRTMRSDAEELLPVVADLNEVDGALFKVRQDPRVTRVGRLLRRSSLDELPQLWNVLKGEMSLVGPRPALPHEVAAYDDNARRRLSVKPGITGPWQVSGRSDLPWSTAIGLDTTYADNHSIAGDLLICAQTVTAVARAKGAY